MDIPYRLVIDLNNNNRANVIEIKRNDKQQRVLFITVMAGDHPADLSDVYAVTAKGINPKGTIIYNDAEILLDENGAKTNVIMYRLSDSASKVSGRTIYEIELSDDKFGQSTSFEFYVDVINLLYDEIDYFDRNDLTAFKSYMIRAEKAADGVEAEINTLKSTYGSISGLLDEPMQKLALLNQTINEVNSLLESGAFVGAQGIQGERGADGVISETDGLMFGFQIVDGDLIYSYWSEEPLPFMINSDGDLIVDFDAPYVEYTGIGIDNVQTREALVNMMTVMDAAEITFNSNVSGEVSRIRTILAE